MHQPVIGLSGCGSRSGSAGPQVCGSGDERGGDVGGVAVEAGPRPVIAHRGTWVCVRSCLWHVEQRDPGTEGRGDERVPQSARA